MSEISKPNEFAVSLLAALGLSDLRFVTRLQIAVEPGFPKVTVEFCMSKERGEAAINVINEYGLEAKLIRSTEAGSSEKSVSLLTLVETTHRLPDSQARPCNTDPAESSSSPSSFHPEAAP